MVDHKDIDLYLWELTQLTLIGLTERQPYYHHVIEILSPLLQYLFPSFSFGLVALFFDIRQNSGHSCLGFYILVLHLMLFLGWDFIMNKS